MHTNPTSPAAGVTSARAAGWRSIAALVAATLVCGMGHAAEKASAATGASAANDLRVGHTVKVMTVGDDRQVPVHLWYPAKTRAFVGAKETIYKSALHGRTLIDELWDPLAWTVSAEFARETEAIEPNGPPFPAIVFSHGSVNDPVDYAHTLERIAGAGFVVAAPSHVGNTQDDVRTDFVNSEADKLVPPLRRRVFACADGRMTGTCTLANDDPGIHASMNDRVRDIGSALAALPGWFPNRVDSSQAGLLGHSRGTVSALAAAGGSTRWGIAKLPRVQAVMGLAIGAQNITSGANLANVSVPTLLVAGGRDRNPLPTVSKAAFDQITSPDKAFVVIRNATHRSFDSTYCDQLRSSAGFASATSRAILDRHTAALIAGRAVAPTTPSGYAAQYCSADTFPDAIRPLVTTLSGFDFGVGTPTTGLNTDEVKAGVTEMAVAFFGTALKRAGNDGMHFTRSLAPKWLEKHGILFDGSDDPITLPNGTVVRYPDGTEVTGDAQAFAGADAVCPPGQGVVCGD